MNPYWGEEKYMYYLLWNSEGERSFGKPKRRREINIKINLNRYYMRGSVDWINLAQDRDKWLAVLNSDIKPCGSTIFWEIFHCVEKFFDTLRTPVDNTCMFSFSQK
jgi:hypothetical protein